MRAREFLIVTLIASAVAVVLTWPLAADMGGRLPHDPRFAPFNGSDMNIWVWNFWWAGRVMEGTGSPFYCTEIYPATGHSLAFHTHTLLWGLLAVPLQWVGGLFFAVNAMVLALLVSASVAAYALARCLGLRAAASGLVGLAWGFSPYFLHKGLVHLNLFASPWMPLCLLCLLRWMNVSGGRVWPHAVGAGIAVGLSLLTGSLQTVYLVASGAVLVLVAPSLRLGNGRGAANTSQAGQGGSAASTASATRRAAGTRRRELLRPWAVLLSLGVLWMVAQPFVSEWVDERAKGAFGAHPQEYHPELNDFFAPSGLHPVFAGLGAAEPRPGQPFAGKRPEHAALTLRLGLLGLAGFGLLLVPGSRRWALGFLLLFLLAWDPGPEPEGYLSQLYRAQPPLDLLRIPARFLPAALLYLSVVAGCGLQALLDRRWGRSIATLLMSLLAFESWIGPYPGRVVQIPKVVTRLAQAPRGVVLSLPYHAGPSAAMIWQTQHGLPVSTSYVARIRPSALELIRFATPDLFDLALGTRIPSPSALAIELRQVGIRHILVRDADLAEPERLHEILDELDGWERFPDPGDGVQWWYETEL